MNAPFKRPAIDGNFRPTHLDHLDWSALHSDRTRDADPLRLIDVPEYLVRRGIGWLARWRRRRSAVIALQALNDHYLNDIGLDRDQIESAVKNAETGGKPV